MRVKKRSWTLEGAKSRRLLALKLREEGLTFREVGEHLGVCSTRAQQMYEKELHTRIWSMKKMYRMCLPRLAFARYRLVESE